MKKSTTPSSWINVFPLLLTAVLAVSILTVLLTGSGLYSRLTARDQSAQRRQTAIQYVTTKVRQAEPGQITLEAFHDLPALVLQETLNGQNFLTRIYCHDGYLRELFTTSDSEMSPDDGEKLLPMESLSLNRYDHLLQIHLTDREGVKQTLVLNLSEKEGCP